LTLTQFWSAVACVAGGFKVCRAAGKFVVAMQRNCWRTRYFSKIRKFEKTTRVKFQLMILHFYTLVPEVYFYYFHCEGERKNKPLVESGN
jgi:hypothetical protein